MEPEGSSPHSQAPATCSYPEPAQSRNLMHKFLFYNKFIIFLYMFRALLCSSSGGQIVLYSIWYRHTL